MSTSLASRIQLITTALLTSTIGVAAADAKIDRSTLFNWTSGVGADMGDLIYTTQITRTHGAPAGNLDLAGALTDAFGNTITMARVKALLFFAAVANVNSVVIGGGASAPITSIFFDYAATALAQPAMKLRPGGMVAIVAPQATAYAITATTADKIQIASGDEDATTSVTVDVVIIGASA